MIRSKSIAHHWIASELPVTIQLLILPSIALIALVEWSVNEIVLWRVNLPFVSNLEISENSQ